MAQSGLLQPSLRQPRHPKPATPRHTISHQSFIKLINLSNLSKRINPNVATAATLTIVLTLFAASCSSPNSQLQPSGTPPGTYLLTLTATSPPTSAPPTLPLALTVQ
jgi:hypothetical protein